MHLKWVLLLVCVAYVLWPLLSRQASRGGKRGELS
jgi:hypothetical protein